MSEYRIPNNIPKIITPKIPGTTLPNPLGRAEIDYGNGITGYIDLYYLQKGIRTVVFTITKAVISFKYKRYKRRGGGHFRYEE